MEKEKELVEKLFRRCAERGWIKELIPSSITLEEIEKFEKEHEVTLPSFFKAFLMAYQLPCEDFEICGIAEHVGEISPLWLLLYNISSMDKLSERIKIFQEDSEELCNIKAENCKKLILIGDWGAGWGPLCIDLAKDEALVDREDENTWSLVWFDHEEFDWKDYYEIDEEGWLHGSPAAPNLETLLEWYFNGSLEAEFEEENQVKVSYERLNNYDFCSSYWEDKWK